MGPSARVAAFALAVTLAACAVIAGLDDPQTVADATSAEAGSSGSLQDTGSGSSSGGSSANDGASDGAPSSGDAQPDVPACTLLPNGDNCTQPSQCCSNKCNEKKQCANECKTQGTFNCDPTSDDDCCVGLWCNTGSCSGCIASGQPAAQGIGGIRLQQSCCSRSLEGGFGPNCQ